MLVKKGSVRTSNPGYATLSKQEIRRFRSQYELLLQAVRRRDSAAVDGPRCAIQLAEIAEAERMRIEMEISTRRRKRRKNRKRGKSMVTVGRNKLKPKNLPVGSVRKLSIDAMLRNSAARAARLMRLKPSKKSSTDSSSMDTGNDFFTGSDSDSSIDSKNGSPTTSMGGRQRRTRKLQKRRKTNMIHRRGGSGRNNK